MTQTMLPSDYPIICTCGHVPELHENGGFCPGCSCRKYKPNPSQKSILSATISTITYKKFRNYVALRHGLKKGAISFEVERVLREYMGDKNLDVLMNDKEWKLLNK
jgi:hypothetical protein